MRLFHLTSKASAEKIIYGGFSGDSCWLSSDVETVCGESGRSVLLEVRIDIPETELQSFERHVVDEVWNDEQGEFVPDPSARPYVWYEIPTSFIAAHDIHRVNCAQRKH